MGCEIQWGVHMHKTRGEFESVIYPKICRVTHILDHGNLISWLQVNMPRNKKIEDKFEVRERPNI